MSDYICTQRGCEFESEHIPDYCPICKNPYVHVSVDPVVVIDIPLALDETNNAN